MAHKLDRTLITEIEDFECTICLGIIKNAMRSPCGHIFCSVCITKHLTNQNNCPVCRDKLEIGKCWKNPEIDNRIKYSIIACESCNKQVKLAKYDSHMAKCTTYQSKLKVMREESLSKTNLTKVDKNRSTFPCPYCTVSNLTNSDLIEHVQRNHAGDNTPIVCPICAVQPWGNSSQVSYYSNSKKGPFKRYVRKIHAILTPPPRSQFLTIL